MHKDGKVTPAPAVLDRMYYFEESMWIKSLCIGKNKQTTQYNTTQHTQHTQHTQQYKENHKTIKNKQAIQPQHKQAQKQTKQSQTFASGESLAKLCASNENKQTNQNIVSPIAYTNNNQTIKQTKQTNKQNKTKQRWSVVHICFGTVQGISLTSLNVALSDHALMYAKWTNQK